MQVWRCGVEDGPLGQVKKFRAKLERTLGNRTTISKQEHHCHSYTMHCNINPSHCFLIVTIFTHHMVNISFRASRIDGTYQFIHQHCPLLTKLQDKDAKANGDPRVSQESKIFLCIRSRICSSGYFGSLIQFVGGEIRCIGNGTKMGHEWRVDITDARPVDAIKEL